MPESTRVPTPSPEHRRISAERFEHARRAESSGNHDYAVQLLLTCCKLDPANLVYRQELRRNQKAKHKNNLRGGFFSFLTTAKPKTKLKAAKRGRDYLRVLEHGEQVLTRNPWDLGAQMDMAEAADAAGMLDVAIFILGQARQKDAKDAGLNRAMARLLEKRGNFTEAIKLWEMVRQKVPADAEAQHKSKDLAASETIKRGHYDEAITEESPVMKMALEARTTAANERVTREVDGLVAKIETEPTQSASYLQLAAHHRKQGRSDAALEILQKGVGPTGSDFQIQVEIAELELEPFRKNLNITDEQLKADPSNEDLRKLRVKLLKEVNTRELEMMRLKSDRHPNDLNLRLDLGIRLMRAGQTEEAIGELQQVRKDPRLLGKAAMYLGFCFKTRNNWRLAERNFREAQKNLPVNEETSRKEVMFQLATGCAEAGETAEAIELGHELANLDYLYRDIGRLLDEWQTKLQKA